jgi:hypothetical protein
MTTIAPVIEVIENIMFSMFGRTNTKDKIIGYYGAYPHIGI